MTQQGNPNQKNTPHQAAGPASEKNEKLNTNNPPAEKKSSSNDDYKRDSVHLGASASGNAETQETTGGTQKGGGGAGYDVSREQQEVNREQEIMHTERDDDKLNPERTQTPQPATPERQSPEPEQPKTQPGTSTQSATDRNINGT